MHDGKVPVSNLVKDRDFDTLNSLHIHICVVNSEGIITRTNRKWDEFAALNSPPNQGLPRSMGVGASYLKACELAAPEAADGIRSVLRGEAPHFTLDYPCHSPDKERWFKMTVTPLENDPSCVVISHKDATNRIQSEIRLNHALREFEELKTALDIHSIVARTDLNGVITYANDNFCKISKFSRDELIGKTHKIVNSGYHPREFMENLWSTISKGESWSGNICNKAKDGSYYWVSSTIVPLRNDSGELSEYLVFRKDITAFKSDEHDYHFLLQTLGVGVWRRKLLTNEVYWDATMYKLYDMLPTDAKDTLTEWLNLLTSETRNRIQTELEAALRGEKEFDTTFQITLKSGKTRELRSRAFVLRTSNGEPIEMHGITMDRSRELELEAMASLSVRLAALGEVSTGLTHEIRNPLAIIAGTAGLLKKSVSQPEKFEKHVATIERSCARIEQIIKSMTKFSRGDGNNPMQLHSLSSIVQDTLPLIHSKTKTADTELSCEIKTEAGIFCDEIKVGQVIINLVNNAVDAVRGLPKRWVKIEVLEEDQKILLRVTDSGSGIPASIRENLFDPFFTTKAAGEGTGLGLSITKSIVNEHAASIRVDDKVPNTCFEIAFPKSKDANQ